MKDQKTKDVSTGSENTGPIMHGGKCRTGKCGKYWNKYTLKAQYHDYRRTFLMAVMASVHGEQKRECPQGTSAMLVFARARFEQAHLACICGILLRRWHRWFLCVIDRHGRRRCYPTVPVAAHQCVLLRVGTAFACNCPASFAILTRSCVSLFCGAFQPGHEHVVKRKMAVLQMLSRQTHNITHSLTANVIYINANCYCRAFGQLLWNK